MHRLGVIKQSFLEPSLPVVKKQAIICHDKHPSINKMLTMKEYEMFNIGKAHNKPEKLKRKTFQRTVIRDILHMYDIHYCSACYWIKQYKRKSSIK